MEYRIEDMFPCELDQRITDGKDMAVLPIGSVEQHGPHLLLGCDSFITQMLADFTAELSGGVLFPLIPFSWIGGLRVWSGTIDIRPRNMGDYLEEVCLNILNMGFKKLLIINCHGGGREMVFSVSRRVFKLTGIPILSIYPSHVYSEFPELEKIWEDYGSSPAAAEASKMMGALKEYGRVDLLQKVQRFVKEALEEFGEDEVESAPPSATKCFEISEVGHDYLEETRHVSPRSDINPDAGIVYTRAMAEKLAQSMKKLVEYHKHLGI